MVADALESADGPMWKTLRSKMKIVGRAVDGLEDGRASGDILEIQAFVPCWKSYNFNIKSWDSALDTLGMHRIPKDTPTHASWSELTLSMRTACTAQS